MYGKLPELNFIVLLFFSYRDKVLKSQSMCYIFLYPNRHDPFCLLFEKLNKEKKGICKKEGIVLTQILYNNKNLNTCS